MPVGINSPLKNILTSPFQVTTLRPNGQPLEGVTIRLVNGLGQDMTASLFGTPTPQTDANGILLLRGIASLLKPGNYRVQASKPGWITQTQNTLPLFSGSARFLFTLQPEATQSGATGSYAVVRVPERYVTPLGPIEYEVSFANPQPGDLLSVDVIHSDGRKSTIECPVDSLTKTATVDVRSRIRLKTAPLLVPNNKDYIDDKNISDLITVNLSARTDNGLTPILVNGIANHYLSVANVYMPGLENNIRNLSSDGVLYDFTNIKPMQWITPFSEMIVRRGYYQDVMFWLPNPAVSAYQIFKKWFRADGLLFTTTVLTFIPHSQFVQRLKINVTPDDDVAKCELTIFDGGQPISKPLIVNYA